MYATYLNSIFLLHGYDHDSIHICTQVTMATNTIISRSVYLWFLVSSFID